MKGKDVDKSVIVIKEPEGDGAYVLLVSRPGGGLMSSAQAAFYVDTLTVMKDNKGQPYMAQGRVADKEIVSFPWGIPYMMLAREHVTFIDTVEAASRQREEEKAVEAVWKQKKEEDEEKDSTPGNYL